ncbi:family helicase [Moniliophthora roreri MCA 2997]|uniref:Family helicase n=1 Tax=Moniliophthora roreri (strain MCA 2997) TaxID=1381753 RepID=V2X4P9_MONRO|nr:family helicase [Moniliophthora roreri MCA 2997]
MTDTDPAVLSIQIESVMKMDIRQVEALISTRKDIFSSPGYPVQYLTTLNDNDCLLVIKAIIIGTLITDGREIPREHQVHAVQMSFEKDSAVFAGTGSGKTFIIAILNTLAGDLEKKYKIPTLAINGETNRTSLFWKGPNCNLGRFRHFLVTPEQLFMLREGYYLWFGYTIRDPDYKRLFGCIFVDEAHFIYFAGVSHYSLPAFCPAYDQLSEIKAMFAGIPWHALTATAPPHVYWQIVSSILTPRHALIQYSSNQPNTVYATHQIIGTIDDMFNYRMFIQDPLTFDFNTHLCILLFFDNRQLCKAVCKYLRMCLPASGLLYPKKDIIWYYRGSMLTGFLKEAHEAFTSETGNCQIYCSTKSNSTMRILLLPLAIHMKLVQSIDYPGVDIVVNVGVPEDARESLQHGGHVVQQPRKNGLYLVLYEGWVEDIDLESYNKEQKNISPKDPDRPRAPLTAKSTRHDHASLSMVTMIQNKDKCIRQSHAEHLNNTAETALIYYGPHCCDRHNDGFSLQSFLPGIIPTEPLKPPLDQKSHTYNKYRLLTSDRELLEQKLRRWRQIVHKTDPLHAVYLEEYIIWDKAIKTVCWAVPFKVETAELLQELLEETDDWHDDWAQKIVDIVKEFDKEKVKVLSKRKKDT